MKPRPFTRLEEVILDRIFPEVDLALRSGRHIDRDDGDHYSFLVDAQDFLEQFYHRYGCELMHAPEGYFFLLPSGDRLGRRHLSAGEMLVGQALALLYLDPTTMQSGGDVPRAQLIERLEALLGRSRLVAELNPRRKSPRAEHVAEESVRSEIDKALRGLSALGFVELGEETLRVRAPVLRFVEPVRGTSDRAAALGRLVREGKVAPMEAHVEEEEP